METISIKELFYLYTLTAMPWLIAMTFLIPIIWIRRFLS